MGVGGFEVRRWLLAGALAAETLPVVRRLDHSRVISRRLVAGTLGGEHVAVLTCGVGPDKAGQRGRETLQEWKATHLVSFGTCGALADDLPVRSVVSACAIRVQERWETLDVVPSAKPVSLITVRSPVSTAQRRQELFALGAQVCEMEALAIRGLDAGLPFYALKVVSDLAGGDADEPLASRNPLNVLRFQALAAKLVDSELAPALEAFLSAYASRL